MLRRGRLPARRRATAFFTSSRRPRSRSATTIGIILKENPIRAQLVAYADRVIVTGLIVSLITALLVFASLYLVLVRPMRRITRAMVSFRDDPEDPARIVQASARQDEIGIAERELAAMQRDLYGFLQQKTRLAALGAAMARIQHDLRNILSNAQLASDRLSAVDDPVVKKLAPRLVASIDRAVSLATNTLRYGRADERPPKRQMLCLAPLVAEAAESAIEARIAPVDIAPLDNTSPTSIQIDADAEQLYRMVHNLVRNAVEALVERGTPGRICIAAERHGQRVRIDITDDGPGIPAGAGASGCSSPSRRRRAAADRASASRSRATWRARMAATSRWSRRGDAGRRSGWRFRTGKLL